MYQSGAAYDSLPHSEYGPSRMVVVEEQFNANVCLVARDVTISYLSRVRPLFCCIISYHVVFLG